MKCVLGSDEMINKKNDCKCFVFLVSNNWGIFFYIKKNILRRIKTCSKVLFHLLNSEVAFPKVSGLNMLRLKKDINRYLNSWSAIPHICHESHENSRVNFFWPV